MSTCLDDARLQAVADGEGPEPDIEHVRTCPACGERVDAARYVIEEFRQNMASLDVPPSLRPRVLNARSQSSSGRSGATTLRHRPTPFVQRPAWFVAGGALAASVIAIVFVLLPTVDPTTRLNAAEILDRSLQTLTVQGIESLKYELTIDAPGAAAMETGTYRIEQLIDHDSGRWRFARFAPDGTFLSGIAEDPAAHTRDAMIRHHGEAFRFHFDLPADQHLPLWDLQRRYAEAMIRLVQVSAAQVVTATSENGEPRYVVELPETRKAGAPALMVDLNRARVVIDATDFHIIEFSAAGSLMGQAVSVGYRLMARDVWDSAPPDAAFELPVDPAAIELRGEGSKRLPADLMSLLLGEVARAKR